MKSLLITGLLAAFTLAQPHRHNHHRRAHAHRAVHQHENAPEKRGIHTHWEIKTEWVTVTEYVKHTNTVYEAKPKATKDAQFHESDPETTPAPKVEQPAPAAPAPAAAQPLAAPPAPAPPAPAAYSPPPAANIPAAVPSPPERDAGVGSTGGYTSAGEMTFYVVGLGACGWDDSGRGKSDYIVALNAPTMGAQSNGNPMCGKKVEISYNGKTIVAEVRDKCPECAPGDLDVSEGAFVALCGGTGPGRVKINWKFV